MRLGLVSIAPPFRCVIVTVKHSGLRLSVALLLSIGLPCAQAATSGLAALVEKHGLWVGSSSYTPPVYEITADTRTCRVDVGNAFQPLAARWKSVPLPCDFQPADGTDSEAIVLDHVNDMTYEFWAMARDERGRWRAEWGGADRNSSFVQTPYGRQWRKDGGSNYGTQASGLSFIPGMVLERELRAGKIPHAVQISVPFSCAEWKWPATRTDGNAARNDPSQCVPLGQVWKLPPGTDLSALTPFARMVARAAIEHGLVATDQTFNVVGIRVENWRRKWPSWSTGEEPVDPYASPGGHFGCDGRYNGRQVAPHDEFDCYPDHKHLFANFPWDKLVPIN